MRQKPSFRHHFVPVWHLRLFGHGTDGRKVFYYDKQTSTFDEADVSKFWKKHYYTLPPGGSSPRDALERALAQIESDAAPAARALLEQIGQARFTLASEARVALAEYLASLHVRVPAARNALLAESNRYVVEETTRRLSDRGGWLADARRRSMTSTDDDLDAIRIETLREVGAGALDEQLTDDFSLAALASTTALAEVLLGMPWQLVRRRALPMFVLGDHPVMHCVSAAMAGGSAAPPFIMVPLAPNALLVMAEDVPPERDGRILSADDLTGEQGQDARRVLRVDDWWQADQAARCNWVSWQGAERYIWGATQADLHSVADRLDQAARDAPGHHSLTLRRVASRSSGGPAEAADSEVE